MAREIVSCCNGMQEKRARRGKVSMRTCPLTNALLAECGSDAGPLIVTVIVEKNVDKVGNLRARVTHTHTHTQHTSIVKVE